MRTGLDRLAATPDLAVRLGLRGARVALLAHPASVTRDLVHARDVLAELGAAPAIVFGPEHGYGGEAQDMIGVDDARDRHGTKVRSLYGATFADLSPRAEDLAHADVLVVDLQDVGARYYTFVWTAVLAARACAAAGVRVVVLDRPNPIGRDDASIEGRLQADRFTSFVGLAPVPIRHASTLGEIVAWRAAVERLDLDLAVVGYDGLAPEAHADAWDRPFVMPSPNMPTYATALVYPGGCLLEGTNLSDGRGTTRPFEITGAPWVDGAALARDLGALALPGVRFRPVTFRPTFHKHAGATCGGVQVHVVDARTFRPVATYVALVAAAHHAAPHDFAFRTAPYEFVDDVPAFDLLTGSTDARLRIAAGDPPADVARAVAAVGEEERAVVAAARAAIGRRAV